MLLKEDLTGKRNIINVIFARLQNDLSRELFKYCMLQAESPQTPQSD